MCRSVENSPKQHFGPRHSSSLPVPVTRTIAGRRRFGHVLGFVLLAMISLPAMFTQNAHALGADPTNLLPATTVASAGAGPWLADPTLTFTIRRHAVPDDLPGLVRDLPATIGKQAALAAMAQRVKEEQIFWRYSGQRASLSPWIQATRDKKHAAMTGRGPFLVIFLAFLAMSGVTVALWRQTGALIVPQPGRRGGPRRLR